jgi:hypothetical protein
MHSERKMRKMSEECAHKQWTVYKLY